MRKNEKGFTLVELMVVLAILGLLVGVGVPQYWKVMERARIGRDLAAIATVQTAVNAFLSETQWRPSSDQDFSLEISATSYLTGGTVKISDFWEGSLPKLESERFGKEGTVWRIDVNGIVYVQNDTGRLPDKPSGGN